ncbi:MAG: diguanylate cyclase [Gemmatimonadota bacterium]
MLSVLLAAAITVQGPVAFPTSAVTDLRAGWRYAVGDNAAWSRPGYLDASWRAAAVPAPWSAQGLEDFRGYVWYRLHYTLDSAAVAPLGLRFTGATGAYEVFADGRSIGGVGSLPPRYRARANVPVTVAFPPEALTRGEHVVAVRVYSEENVGGIVGPVLAGPLDELVAREWRTSDFLLATALFLVGVGIMQVFFYARRPEAVEHLLIFVFTLALAALFIVWMPQVRATLSASLDYYRLYLFFGSAAAAFFCFAFRRIFEVEDHRWVTGIGVYFACLAPLGFLLPGFEALRAVGNYLLSPGLLIASLVVVAIGVQQVRRGVDEARILLAGIAILTLTLVHDVFAEWGWLGPRIGLPWLVHGGSVALVLCVGYVTARKFVDTASIALNDRLTGLYRREVVMDALNREIRRSARTHQPIALIMMDLDNFKSVNDSYGHPAGDRMLAEVGRRLAEAGRAVDWLGRYGGEEFIAVLAASPLGGAELAAERFRQAVSALPIELGRASRTVTLSAGIAAYDGGAGWPTPAQLVGAADAALYRAKAAGKNQVHD